MMVRRSCPEPRTPNPERMLGRRAQSAVEYMMILAVGIMALVSMFGPIRDAFMHRMKGGADGVGLGLLE